MREFRLKIRQQRKSFTEISDSLMSIFVFNKYIKITYLKMEI